MALEATFRSQAIHAIRAPHPHAGRVAVVDALRVEVVNDVPGEKGLQTGAPRCGGGYR